MSPAKRCAKNRAKARRRRYLKTHERLARDRRQAQQAAEALQQALDELGLPEDLVAEIEGRLRSQHKLLGKICGIMEDVSHVLGSLRWLAQTHTD
jgi:hypothetical protein